MFKKNEKLRCLSYIAFSALVSSVSDAITKPKGFMSGRISMLFKQSFAAKSYHIVISICILDSELSSLDACAIYILYLLPLKASKIVGVAWFSLSRSSKKTCIRRISVGIWCSENDVGWANPHSRIKVEDAISDSLSLFWFGWEKVIRYRSCRLGRVPLLASLLCCLAE